MLVAVNLTKSKMCEAQDLNGIQLDTSIRISSAKLRR